MSKKDENSKGKLKKEKREQERVAQEKRTKRNKIIIPLVAVITIGLIVWGVISLHEKAPFYYSDGIDENGFFSGVTATDYVDIFDYTTNALPADLFEVTEAELKSEANSLLSDASAETIQVTNRAILNGDNVNIDYVGTIDGVEFEGGNTGGAGTDVTAGSADYIDDFLTQIIGHYPGETFEVAVTFPESYSEESLQGKDAIFTTTINYISDYDVTDALVSEYLSEDYGWTTVAEMNAGLTEGIKDNSIVDYILDNCAIKKDVPKSMIEYQGNMMVVYYENSADSYGVDFETFLTDYLNVASVAELKTKNAETLQKNAEELLKIQAIAETFGITIDDTGLATYIPNYSSYVDSYGLPYLKQMALNYKVNDDMVARSFK